MTILLVAAGCGASDDGAEAIPDATTPDTGSVLSSAPTEIFEQFSYAWSQQVVDSSADDPETITPASVISSTRVDGIFVAPDRHRVTQTRIAGDAESTTELLSIGAEAWVRFDAGPWQAVVGDVASAFPAVVAASALNPAFLDDGRIRSALDGETPTTSTNGDGLAVELFEFSKPREPAIALLHVAPEASLSFDGEVTMTADSLVVLGWRLRAEGPPDQMPADVPAGAGRSSRVALEIQLSLTDLDDATLRVESPIEP